MNQTEILSNLNAMNKNTLLEVLDIEFVEVGEDFLTARMPVTPKVHQPMGYLHGGASMALAESVASSAAYLHLGTSEFAVFGLEISGNHVRSKKEGTVYATARPVHKGKTTQVWEIRITDEGDRLISVCKMTSIIVPKKA